MHLQSPLHSNENTEWAARLTDRRRMEARVPMHPTTRWSMLCLQPMRLPVWLQVFRRLMPLVRRGLFMPSKGG
jgi:hypothetical protein